MKEEFIKSINEGYSCKGKSIILGGPVFDGESASGIQVKIPLSTLNRHGLVAGATGTGKTKTLQVIAESLSDQGISCLMMDIKGDLSGLAAPGEPNNKISERHARIGNTWEPSAFPVELLTISDEKGTRLRATVIEFGPVLLSLIHI